MSFQAYLDTIEDKTGKIPADLIAEAHEHGYNADTKAGEIIKWLKDDYALGRGHAMAIVHVIKNGTKIDEKHVNSGTTHSDPTNELRLDGKANRNR